MTWFRWSVPLLSLAVAAAPAPAQGIIVYNPYVSGTSVTYSTRLGKHGALSISSAAFGPHGYSYGVFGSSSGYLSYSRSTTITISPTIIVLPRDSLSRSDDDYLRDLTPRRDLDRDDGLVRPMEPDNRKRAERVPPPEPPKKPEEPPPPEQKLLPLPRPPMPEANPVAECARLVGLGKTAFAEQQYGRAAERFLQASKLTPNDAQVQFLRAQAMLALGKYFEAVDAIYAGMALQPDWPMKRFQPLELYGQHVADYPEHLLRLENAAVKHPNEPTLLFLFAYQLWFDGRKDEARVLFQRARPGAADPAVIDRFLQAKPVAPPVAISDAPRKWL